MTMDFLVQEPGLRTADRADARLGGMPSPATAPADRAISTAYRDLRGTLLGFLIKQTGDPQIAEDLLHDVMLKVPASEQSGRAVPDSIGGWLYAVARNNRRTDRPGNGVVSRA